MSASAADGNVAVSRALQFGCSGGASNGASSCRTFERIPVGSPRPAGGAFHMIEAPYIAARRSEPRGSDDDSGSACVAADRAATELALLVGRGPGGPVSYAVSRSDPDVAEDIETGEMLTARVRADAGRRGAPRGRRPGRRTPHRVARWIAHRVSRHHGFVDAADRSSGSPAALGHLARAFRRCVCIPRVGRRLRERPLSAHAFGALGWMLLEDHRAAFERDGVAVWSTHTPVAD